VPRSRSSRTFRETSRREENIILHIGYPLNELFDEKEIEDFMAAAKRRIIGEFHYAMETNPRFKPGSDRRPKRRTDNYIIGLGRKPSELADYVNRTMHRRFITASQLPVEFQDMRPKLIEMMLRRAEHDVIMLAIQAMLKHTHEIWYDEGVGIWQACQSSVDEFLAYKQVAKAARVKADLRPFHGRVRSQSRSRNIPGGTSVGLA
jgi:hypothetical protein